ncbi:MAG: cysteine--tRNA ligase [Parcubacteria group bacterium]|nr:cysteine--tRNA ligase [Parcubacteria group bacterium]
MLQLYNTLTKKKEVFKPLRDKTVTLYTCGPTVYSFAHLGNLRTYIFEDILKRVLLSNGYKIKHLMNITDVGHLTSDADTGEDKIEKEAHKEKKTAWQIAQFYTQAFFQDIKKLNILKPNLIKKATDYIAEDIELIKALEKNGFTYKTSDGIYFDTSKLKDYGKLTGMTFEKLNQTLKGGSRIEISPEKKNITDFSLWKFSPKNIKRQMEWDSPWGIGFPGWHIECATLNLKFLAQAFQGKKFVPQKAKTIDIHCGGIDHIPIHHTNEIAQVEAVTKKPFVNFWLHGEFLVLPKGRMGKSEGNAILLKDLENKGFSPLVYRYLILNSHYRTTLEFSLEALQNSQNSLNSLREFVYDCLWCAKQQKNKPRNIISLKKYHQAFQTAINDDLNTPQALAVLWQLTNEYYQLKKDYRLWDKINFREVLKTTYEFDQILGLDLNKIKINPLPPKIQKLIKQRELKRQEKKFQEADLIRTKIEKLNFKIEDTPWGPKIIKI